MTRLVSRDVNKVWRDHRGLNTTEVAAIPAKELFTLKDEPMLRIKLRVHPASAYFQVPPTRI
tara:strand:+ start:411 stop:596 length:186 start_codon:yes stop_codon:yes gene_type:complete